jgi:hypothetical protein
LVLGETERIVSKCRARRQIRARRLERALSECLVGPEVDEVGAGISVGIGAIEFQPVNAIRKCRTHSQEPDHAVRIRSDGNGLRRVLVVFRVKDAVVACGNIH